MTAQAIIVVPCYNEESRLALPRFVEFADAHPHCRFLFVNDGSKDRTGPMLQAFCEKEGGPGGQFRVLSLERNQGKAQAVRQGMHEAMGDPRAGMVGFWDADLATSLDVIPQFIDEFERYPTVEIVMGSRVRLLGRDIDRKFLRHLIGRFFATAASRVLRLPVYDTQCGAKMFRVNEQMRSLFGDPFRSRWVFDVEILARYLRMRRKAGEAFDAHGLIHEIPLPAWKDVGGSRLRIRDFFRAGFDLIRIRMGRY